MVSLSLGDCHCRRQRPRTSGHWSTDGSCSRRETSDGRVAKKRTPRDVVDSTRRREFSENIQDATTATAVVVVATKKLVNENVPQTRSSSPHYRCQNQRSSAEFQPSSHLGLNRKFVNDTFREQEYCNNQNTQTHADDTNYHHSRDPSCNEFVHVTKTTMSTHRLLLKVSIANLALIYVILTSISTPNQLNLCSATPPHHQVVTTNFYWPTPLLKQHYSNFQNHQQRLEQHNLQLSANNLQQQQPQPEPQLQVSHSIRSIANGNQRRSLSSSAAAAAAAAAAALATANAALARRGQSKNLVIGQSFNNFSSAVPYSVMMQDVDYSIGQEDQVINEPAARLKPTSLQQIIQQGPTAGHSVGFIDEPPQKHQPMQEYPDIITSANDTDHQRLNTRPTLLINSLSLDSLLSAAQQVQQQQSVLLNKDASGSEVAFNNQRGSSKAASDRALLPLDSNRLILPQMQQIKARFNQGCVGGTKCQFFAFCWMSGGSLGASCGLLMTCCVTPSRQEIQPGFFGPVVNDPYCGRSTSKINRIVGGTDASFGQFPWQAFVQVGGSRCGGALISSRHVVTAGHCVASIKVTLGDYILNSDIESIPHEVFSVVEVLLHPNFRFTPQADRYDVAVLELDRAASYKDNIKPICLPQKDATFVGRVAYVAGWGALQAGSKLRPKVLQHVAVPVIENHVCESWHRRKGIDIRIYDEMMCAGYELGQRDACQGDSGGPLMLNQFGVWYLVGIVSAGYSCAKQYQPGIYHRVSSSSDWISSNVYQQGSSK